MSLFRVRRGLVSLALLPILSAFVSPVVAEEVSVASPSGEIVATVNDKGGRAFYSVSYKGEDLIAASRLGLLFNEKFGFDENLAIIDTQTASVDDSWEQPWGERRFVRDHHNELAVTFASTSGPDRQMIVRLRVFDDGLGFRYEIPKQKALKGEVNITEELTQFDVGADSIAWWIPSGEFNRYEYVYLKSPAGEIQDAHTPITFRGASGAYFSIHEAALVDYASMSLQRLRPGNFQAHLSPWSDGVLVKAKAPFATPWRTIQISPDAKGLLNSSLILNLNEPNKLGDVSYFKPGKYVGVWWEMHIRDSAWATQPVHGARNENVKRYIDFAAKNGFSGVLVEGWNTGWDDDWFANGKVFSFTQSTPDFDLPMLATYAAEKDVRLIGHHETGGAASHYESQMEDALALYEDNGVRIVKTGYVADAGDIQRIGKNGVTSYEWHDGQFMARHHLKVVEAAHKHHIAINPHEPIKDTGLRRTYPNWVSREGARGQEFNAWGTPPNPPEHTAILPFTRMLAGPMDFTPGIFDLMPNEKPPIRPDYQRSDPSNRPQTTLAKQLALYVVLYSPIQMAADEPENYEARPDAFQFIKDVPTDWEESIAVAGEIGDYVAFARKERGGEDWYLGALTDEEARTLEVPLDFLDADQTYTAEIYRDGDKADWKDNPYDIKIYSREVNSGDVMKLPLATSGGAAIRFIPAGAE